ncbi:MAG: hypothetical protein MHMPM18_000567 [Marteilia pararefringens]
MGWRKANLRTQKMRKLDVVDYLEKFESKKAAKLSKSTTNPINTAVGSDKTNSSTNKSKTKNKKLGYMQRKKLLQKIDNNITNELTLVKFKTKFRLPNASIDEKGQISVPKKKIKQNKNFHVPSLKPLMQNSSNKALSDTSLEKMLPQVKSKLLENLDEKICEIESELRKDNPLEDEQADGMPKIKFSEKIKQKLKSKK